MKPNAAIHYEDDAFRIDVPKLMGRQMAGNGFLHGFLRHGGVDTLYAHSMPLLAGKLSDEQLVLVGVDPVITPIAEAPVLAVLAGVTP